MTEWPGLLRSLIVYWRPGRQHRLRQLYCSLVSPGDLVFDVGAHLGDRSAAFAALGAHVVAIEPQPHVACWLRRIVARYARVTVRDEAVGRSTGTARLAISRRNPTVSTLAKEWREKLPRANRSFRDVKWETFVDVQVTTLDALIDMYGMPRFCKIDVEGYESEVLVGLTRPIPGISIEFISGNLDQARVCVERLRDLGMYEFNAIRGENRGFVFDNWVTPEQIIIWLKDGAGGVSSGDLYARLLHGIHHD